jgi:hypothetical protein
MKRAIALLAGCLVLAGCLNMPTPPVQITGSYQSTLQYEQFDCPRLYAELDSLNRREGQLVAAQEQRVRTSQMQAFWWGFGQGDGVEATELANVRGQKEAVTQAIANKQCAAPGTTAPSPAPAPAPAPQ